MPEAVSSSPSRVVVVVLPLVPLTANSGRRMKGAATSSSPTTGRPAARAAVQPGSLRRHPGGQDDGIKPLPAGLGHAQVFHHPEALDVPAGVGQVIRRRLVGDRHPGPVLGQETAQRHPGPGQADD